MEKINTWDFALRNGGYLTGAGFQRTATQGTHSYINEGSTVWICYMYLLCACLLGTGVVVSQEEDGTMQDKGGTNTTPLK